MIGLIEDNYESLKNLCEQYRVQRLEVFGSALTGEGFDSESSDLDFLVEFLPLQPGEHADCYFGLRHTKSLFPRVDQSKPERDICNLIYVGFYMTFG